MLLASAAAVAGALPCDWEVVLVGPCVACAALVNPTVAVNLNAVVVVSSTVFVVASLTVVVVNPTVAAVVNPSVVVGVVVA